MPEVTGYYNAKYIPRHTDGILGDILAGSSLNTMMKKKRSDINLSTLPFYSTACHIYHCKCIEFDYIDVTNINTLYSLKIPSM